MAARNATRTAAVLAALASLASLAAGCVGRIGALENEGDDAAVEPFDAAPGEDVRAGADVRPGADVQRADAAFEDARREDAQRADAQSEDARREDVPPACVPRAEVCNGVDDDCDGAVDDGLGTQTCGMGACARTAPRCAAGAPAPCAPGAPAAETCNMVDDDCDGTVDEGACTSGTPSMLMLVNTARATGRMCGATFYPAVPALTWDARLEAAAQEHSDDMVARNYFDHTGSDGSTVGTRVTRHGYTWRAVGENIAAGQTSEEAAMAGWIASPGHCSNIMSANYTQMGAALARGASYGYYWTQVFARP